MPSRIPRDFSTSPLTRWACFERTNTSRDVARAKRRRRGNVRKQEVIVGVVVATRTRVAQNCVRRNRRSMLFVSGTDRVDG